MDSSSESCANDRAALLETAIANSPELNSAVDSTIGTLFTITNGQQSNDHAGPTIIKQYDAAEDWQRAELIANLNHNLAMMNGSELEEMRRLRVSEQSAGMSLMSFCANILRQSEPIRLVDMGHALKVNKFRSALLSARSGPESSVSLDGKSRKWIQLWLLCHKLQLQ